MERVTPAVTAALYIGTNASFVPCCRTESVSQVGDDAVGGHAEAAAEDGVTTAVTDANGGAAALLPLGQVDAQCRVAIGIRRAADAGVAAVDTNADASNDHRPGERAAGRQGQV